MSLVYLVGDTHFGHKGVTRFRPMFSSDQDHDLTILENINSVVNKRDTLWMLGDIAFNNEAIKLLGEIRTKNINVILGNHDLKDKMLWVRYANNVFGAIKRNRMWWTHIPIHPQELRGIPNVHGHCHNKPIDDPWYFCVSLEQIDYKPIMLHDVINVFKQRGVIQ